MAIEDPPFGWMILAFKAPFLSDFPYQLPEGKSCFRSHETSIDPIVREIPVNSHEITINPMTSI